MPNPNLYSNLSSNLNPKTIKYPSKNLKLKWVLTKIGTYQSEQAQIQ